MKKVSKKVLAVLLAITMVFTLATSVSAFTADGEKITPEVLYAEGFDSLLGVMIDGDFCDYGTTEDAIELWHYDYETEEYAYQCDIPASAWQAIFEIPEFLDELDELSYAGITCLLIDFSEMQDQFVQDDCYKLVCPEDLLVTEDGQSNNAFEAEFFGTDVMPYEETIFEKIINWIYGLPDLLAFFLRPIIFVIEIIEQIVSYIPVPLG